MSKSRKAWLRLGWNAWALGMEASAVIGLRTMKIAAGGAAAEAEALRMVSEKVEAAAALQAMAMTGALGFTAQAASSKAVAHYRRKVQANRRRLTKR